MLYHASQPQGMLKTIMGSSIKAEGCVKTGSCRKYGVAQVAISTAIGATSGIMENGMRNALLASELLLVSITANGRRW